MSYHEIRTKQNDSLTIEVEWDRTECECASEYGNTVITEKWDEFSASTATNTETGEVYDFSEDPAKDWEAVVMARYLDGTIQY